MSKFVKDEWGNWYMRWDEVTGPWVVPNSRWESYSPNFGVGPRLVHRTKPNTEPAQDDAVDSPSHYMLESGKEVIEVIKDSLTAEEYRGHLKASTMKYILRAGKKNNAVEDIGKAKKFLTFLEKEFENE